MKAFIAMLSLVTMISAQAATISSKSVSAIESRIETQRSILNDKINSANTDDIVEGKVVATMSYKVEVLLENAESLLSAVASEKNLSKASIAAKIAEINAVLNDAEMTIQEI